eukprot:CAMPEP_0113714562 /NCGR_PEP_ID=MMETSP0038_2-20120614/32691_1 /TAXON_ID=2898 /ORGANISM="Cryptomonas paramecium" /LENGTH=109 /DNA_ID=CAMNT_0000641563 /DNA_START=196 /DNA_END=521 /DNA_ORIENTATION=+ /assembly_acc=CAM_ASM_000170
MNLTLYGGEFQPAWFDVSRLDEKSGSTQDWSGVEVAARRIADLASQEIASGVPAHRIVLAGFGQGGALALSAALVSSVRLGGVLAMSAWYPRTTAAMSTLVNSQRGDRS